ncbi:Polar-differentiation response regulator divK [Bacteroidales bacterium CF]|jgi:CheY-like chemotaxis protein|nr:Polar-differentiation response regulator divK [Bacteroidales bacterium CF]
MNYSGKTALIADDDNYSAYLLSALLKRIGFDSIIVENGIQAVDTCRQHPEISLIMMDLSMPEMNGIEATKVIKSFMPEITIIAQTAYSIFGDKEKTIEAGCNAYLSKPIDKDELYAAIDRLIK